MSAIPTNLGGRPPLFNAQRAERLLVAVRRGIPFKQAAAYAGVSYDTFNRWRRLGSDEDAPERFRKFCDALSQAEGEAVFRLVGTLDSAATRGDWKAAAWILERRHPSFWGRQHSPQPASDPLEPLFDL